MKWFFALNEASSSFDKYSKMLRVAVYSAYKYTNLEPYFIYDGVENDLTQWLQNRGVKIIFHRVSVYDDLKYLDEQKNSNFFLSIGSGAFQRIDLPCIVKDNGWDDEYVLYTDCDVMFHNQTNFDTVTCKYFAVAPEIDIEDNVNMNSGVMVMNIPNLFQSVAGFHRFVRQNIYQLSTWDWDQTAYRSYYHLEWDKLNTNYNWKPYWGVNPDAKIIHFHGTKPTSEKEVIDGSLSGRPRELADKAGNAYFSMLEEWKKYLDDSNQEFSFEKYKSSWLVRRQIPSNAIDLSLDSARTEAISNGEILSTNADWRSIKGSLVLKIMLDNNDIKSLLEVSNLFAIIMDYEAEFVHLYLAHKLAPDSAIIATKLGINFYKRGDILSALKSFEYANQILPNDDNILVSLGRLHYEMNNHQEAKKYLLKALEVNPASSDALTGLKIVSQNVISK